MTALIWIFGGAALIYLLRGYGLIIFLVCLFTMAGCTTMSPEDREYANQQVREQYAACRDWYEASGVRWVETDARSTRVRGREIDELSMKVSMTKHGCHRYLKSLGY
ncbi:MAG: hypothetical protein ACYS7Y_32220 [Planctomycetota bacterium]|jgi:hypothetical protein